MSRSLLSVVAATVLFSLANAAIAKPSPTASGPRAARTINASGKIAWYGGKFIGRETANGERFNASAMTMAHRTLPFGTRVRVKNLTNNKSVILRVNDRGPRSPALVADVSPAAARKLGMSRPGIVKARLQVVRKAHRRAVKNS